MHRRDGLAKKPLALLYPRTGRAKAPPSPEPLFRPAATHLLQEMVEAWVRWAPADAAGISLLVGSWIMHKRRVRLCKSIDSLYTIMRMNADTFGTDT